MTDAVAAAQGGHDGLNNREEVDLQEQAEHFNDGASRHSGESQGAQLEAARETSGDDSAEESADEARAGSESGSDDESGARARIWPTVGPSESSRLDVGASSPPPTSELWRLNPVVAVKVAEATAVAAVKVAEVTAVPAAEAREAEARDASATARTVAAAGEAADSASGDPDTCEYADAETVEMLSLRLLTTLATGVVLRGLTPEDSVTELRSVLINTPGSNAPSKKGPAGLALLHSRLEKLEAKRSLTGHFVSNAAEKVAARARQMEDHPAWR